MLLHVLLIQRKREKKMPSYLLPLAEYQEGISFKQDHVNANYTEVIANAVSSREHTKTYFQA